LLCIAATMFVWIMIGRSASLGHLPKAGHSLRLGHSLGLVDSTGLRYSPRLGYPFWNHLTAQGTECSCWDVPARKKFDRFLLGSGFCLSTGVYRQ